MMLCKYVTMGITSSYSQSYTVLPVLPIATWDSMIIPGLEDMFNLTLHPY